MIPTQINELVDNSWTPGSFDALSYAVIDFDSKKFESRSWLNGVSTDEKITFDLASLTKPLTLSAFFHLHPKELNQDLRLLLEHRAGLPSWGRLGKDWREQVLRYEIKESEVCYSDFSALRLMLEIEKLGYKLQDVVSPLFDKELMFWKDLQFDSHIPPTGYRKGERIIGDVNDDNCFVISEFCSHAGLFSTVDGLCRTLLNLFDQTNIFDQMNESYPHRFKLGWDQAQGDNSLAGPSFDKGTFGHLGFTGTSFWVNPTTKKGWVLLSNATKEFWFFKSALNTLRRELGGITWSS